MAKTIRMGIAWVLIAIGMVDGVSIFSFLTVRSLPRLIVWNIKPRTEDFFEGNPGGVAHFEQDTPEISEFRSRIKPYISPDADEIETIAAALKFVRENYVMKYRSRSGKLRWGSPSELRSQIQSQVRGANCFHYSILFSTYLSALGFQTRLWALEGTDYLGPFGHTVVEVWIKSFQKWMMTDPSFGFYSTFEGAPVSFLELRRELLAGGGKYTFVFTGELGENRELQLRRTYQALVELAFLRSSADFSYKTQNPKLRWGVLSGIKSFLETLPYYPQRAIELIVGRKEVFYQIKDKHTAHLLFQVAVVRIAVAILAAINIITVGIITAFMRQWRRDKC